MGKNVKQPVKAKNGDVKIKNKPIFKRLDFKKGQIKKTISEGKVCQKFISNSCTLGESCKYLHVKPDSKEPLSQKTTKSDARHKLDSPKKIKKGKAWFNQCKYFQNGKCLLKDCRYFHISAEDKEIFRKTGEVSLNIINQAIKNESYIDNNSKKLGSDMKPACKNFLKGNCTAKDCHYQHISRNKYEKQIYQALRHEMNKLIALEMKGSLPTPIPLLDLNIDQTNFVKGSPAIMLDCREEINRRKMSKLAQANANIGGERINTSFPQNQYQNINFVNGAGYKPEYDQTFAYGMDGSGEALNINQDLRMEVERLQQRNETLLSELSHTNEIVNLNKELKFEIEQLHEQNRNLLNDFRSSNETLKRNKELREEIDILAKRNSDLSSEVNRSNETEKFNRELQREIEKLKQQNRNLSSNYNVSSETIKFNRELQMQVGNLRKQNEKLLKELVSSSEAVKVNKDMQIKIDNLRKENQSLLSGSTNKNWKQGNVLDMERERSSYLEKIKNLEFEIVVLKGDLRSWENYQVDIKERIHKIENQIYFVEQVSSQSWGGGDPPFQSQKDEWTRLKSMLMLMRSYLSQENSNFKLDVAAGTSNCAPNDVMNNGSNSYYASSIPQNNKNTNSPRNKMKNINSRNRGNNNNNNNKRNFNRATRGKNITK